MALFASFRSRRTARRAEQIFAREGFAAAAAVLDGATSLGGGCWAQFAVGLYNQGYKVEAERAIRRALEVEAGRGDALIFLAELLAETEREDEAIETYRQVLARFPGAAAQALALGELLAERDEFAAVKDVLTPFVGRSTELQMLLGQAHFALGEFEAVVATLGPTMRHMQSELKLGLNAISGHRDLYADYSEISRLHDEAYAALHGREKVIEAALERSDLDPRAGVNYRLLGEARLAGEPPWAADTRLRSVDEDLAFGQALIAAGERARGLCHLGSSRLRQGLFDAARKLFDDARAEDDGNFAAYLGLGAAMDLAQGRVFDRLKELPDPAVPASIERVVVDWPALTPHERKVVALAVAPCAGALPRIARAGAIARLLPIDARLTDLPEMEGPVERFEDHRCLQSITGAATERLCASKIEELLMVTGEHDSVFAHELAHLVHFHLPQDLQDEIDALYERALQQEHVITEYQATSSAEFFAVAYTDFLAHEHELPSRRELDDEGLVEETFAFIRKLRVQSD